MLTNIYIPKLVRWLLVATLFSQLLANILHLSTSAPPALTSRQSSGSYSPAELLARTEAELDRCEGKGIFWPARQP